MNEEGTQRMTTSFTPRVAGAALAALLALTSACSVPATPPAPAERPLADGRLMSPEPVALNVWYMRQPPRTWSAVIGNVGIVEQSDGVVLIDSGGSIPDGREIVAAVARLTAKPIKAVVVTHWHNDHPLGLPAILEKFPRARIIATTATARLMADPEVLGVGVGAPDPERRKQRAGAAAERSAGYRQRAQDPSLPEAVRGEYAAEAKWVMTRVQRQDGNYVVVPSETFTSTLLIDDPVAPVQLLFLGRANTKGDAFAWLPRQKVMMTGDAVVLPTPYGFVGPIAPWLATIERLQRYDFKLLIPGHGTVQRDRAYLATLTWSMEDIRCQAAGLARTVSTPEQALARFDRSEHIRRFKADNQWKREWLDGYWLDGMVETAFKQAKGITLEQRPDGG